MARTCYNIRYIVALCLSLVISADMIDIISPKRGDLVTGKQTLVWEDYNLPSYKFGELSFFVKSICKVPLIFRVINFENSFWPVEEIKLCEQTFDDIKDIEIVLYKVLEGRNQLSCSYLGLDSCSSGLDCSDHVFIEYEFTVKIEYDLVKENDIQHNVLIDGVEVPAYTVTFGKGTKLRSMDALSMVQYVDEKPWKVNFGKFTSVARQLQILLSLKGGGHRYDYITTYKLDKFRHNLFPDKFQYSYDQHFSGNRVVTIGSDVWIGFGVKIINAVTIGHGAVLGAYTVIREDVPPYAIVIGNPAKVVKYRFNESQIAFLLKFQWWDLNFEKILFDMPSLDDYEKFYSWATQLTTSTL